MERQGTVMYELDKGTFGEFLASQRKEKGYTQKELAEKLFVSDKAVSKWERALSMPDISLLIPLADILGVTVTELLEGRKMEQTSELDAGHVELLVKKALTFSEDTPEKVKERRKKNGLLFGGCTLFALLELAAYIWCLVKLGVDAYSPSLLCLGIMSFGFGIYFWFFMKEKLPVYYDEYQISAYSDGPFRINIPGVSFNNSNWPYLVGSLRVWSVATMVTIPLVGLFLSFFRPEFGLGMGIAMTILLLYLAGMFLPLYILGKKYGGHSGKDDEKDKEKRDEGEEGENTMKKDGKSGSRKKKGKTVVWLLAMVLLLGVCLFSLVGFGGSYSGVRVGFYSHKGLREWSASYSYMNGTASGKIYPKAGAEAYKIEVETKQGSLFIELTDQDGNIIFSQSNMETGVWQVTLDGVTKVEVLAKEHKGSFLVAPQ